MAQENSTYQTVITSGKSTNQTAELIVLHPILILIRIYNVFANSNHGTNRQHNKHICMNIFIFNDTFQFFQFL